MSRYAIKIKTFIQINRTLRWLSTCKRKEVSAIIFPVDCTAIYAIGYNGPPRQLPNDACTNEEGHCGCVHAEANALLKFDYASAKPSVIHVTCQPCLQCAGLILNCPQIVGLIWDDIYRDPLGMEMLQRSVATTPSLVTVGSHEIERLTPEAVDVMKRWRSLC